MVKLFFHYIFIINYYYLQLLTIKSIKGVRMIIIYIILGIVALLLIIALFVSKELDYEKSISIGASKDLVWQNVSSLTAMDAWSPWNEKDPNMKRTLTGTDAEVGAKQAWESEIKDVGVGSQTIVNIDKPNLFETKLDFIKPFKSTADGYVKLEEDENKIIATWGFKSTMTYPMNLMKLFMNFEKSMDIEFGNGLSKLKQICEK